MFKTVDLLASYHVKFFSKMAQIEHFDCLFFSGDYHMHAFKYFSPIACFFMLQMLYYKTTTTKNTNKRNPMLVIIKFLFNIADLSKIVLKI